MVFVVCVLTNNGVDNSLQNVLLGVDAVHVFDQVVSFVDFIVLEVVDDEVESGFVEDINKRWQDLESIFSSSEDNEVVSKKIIVLINISGR